jgi:excisionase family DNA binding protein
MARKLIEPDAAAKRLGVSTRTLLRYAQRGELWSTFTVGGHRRYDQADVDRLKAELDDEAKR